MRTIPPCSRWAVPLALAAFFIALTAQGQETFDTLVIGTNTFKNARILQASPVDLLIGHEDGFKRLKLQELPEPWKSKYPYDARKAAEYETQKAQEARQRQAQNSAAARAALLTREQEIRTKLQPLEKELKRLNANITTQDNRKKGKGVKSAERKLADELRRQKMEVRDQIWKLKDELERTEMQRRKYE